MLSDAGKHYGEGIIKEYSKRLSNDLGKKYSVSLLYKIIQFYNIIQKVPTVSGNLTWSHWYEMLSIENINKIIYYMNRTDNDNLSVRELRFIIKNREYERLPNSTKNKLIKKEDTSLEDFVKDPIIIRNKTNCEEIPEKLLKQVILEDIDSFLKELGDGFSYIVNEYKIKVGNEYNYIDFLLYNIKYNCYVVVELKVVDLKKEHIGQIHIYMNYIDENVRNIYQDKTIGIIIVRKNNKFIMKYCTDDRIIAREYQLI